MGWRYRKSMTLLPGVRINIGMRGASLSLGGKGFRTSFSTSGRVTRSVSIPGTGLSYVTTNRIGSQSRNTGNRTNDRRTTTQQRSTPVAQNNQTELYTSDPEPQVEIAADYSAIAERIHNIFRYADEPVDWKEVLTEDDNPGYENWDYLKEVVDDVVNGDIDTYFRVLSDVNPLNDLLAYGSEFEFGTDDPRMMAVHFKVNSSVIFQNINGLSREQYNELLQDFVCGCSIRIARDILAILPVRHVIVDASDGGRFILSTDFMRTEVAETDFDDVDASNYIESIQHRMQFDRYNGFASIPILDER